MATAQYQRILPGYRGANPLAYAQQQAASRQADIAARAEAARLLAEQKAAADAARIKAQADAEALKRAAAFNALTTRTNADWNELMAKQKDRNKPKPVKVTEKLLSDKGAEIGSVVREYTPEEFAAQKKAKELADLTAKRDLLKAESLSPSGLNYIASKLGMSRVPAKLATVEEQIKALEVPTELVSTAAAPEVAAAPATAPAAPTPRGFIGSPGANTFLADPSPLGMNRAETNAYAINLNNQATAEVSAPRDLLTSESFPSGYDPGHGSFQVDPGPAPTPIRIEDPGMIPFTPGPQDAPPVAPVIPGTHVQHLIANPGLAKFFNEKYGEGAAEKVLQEAMAAEESQP